MGSPGYHGRFQAGYRLSLRNREEGKFICPSSRIPYNNNRIRYRHYGKTLELMIRKATELEAGVEKDQLIKLLATQMKKSFLTWNKESVDDRKIFKDLDELSSGKIVLDEEVHKLAESRDILARNNTNKKELSP